MLSILFKCIRLIKISKDPSHVSRITIKSWSHLYTLLEECFHFLLFIIITINYITFLKCQLHIWDHRENRYSLIFFKNKINLQFLYKKLCFFANINIVIFQSWDQWNQFYSWFIFKELCSNTYYAKIRRRMIFMMGRAYNIIWTVNDNLMNSLWAIYFYFYLPL